MSATTSLPTSAVESIPRIRLDHLDGIRGVAALYVVGFHVWLNTFMISNGLMDASRVSSITGFFLGQGHIAVEVFIVLSGYCLMLPVLRSKSQGLDRGFGDYIKRRARRILPPYFAALLFSVLLFLCVPGLLNFVAGKTSIFQIYPTILAHLVMLHNLNDDWAIGSIDPPMWSVATEWQIYFLFPVLLIPLWRRFGIAMPIVVGLALGNLSEHQHLLSLNYARYWYIGLFAIGMAAAAISFSSPKPRTTMPSWTTRPNAWLVIAAFLVCFNIFLGYLNDSIQGHFHGHLGSLTSSVDGLIVGAFLVWCACFLKNTSVLRLPLLLRLLSSRPAV